MLSNEWYGAPEDNPSKTLHKREPTKAEIKWIAKKDMHWVDCGRCATPWWWDKQLKGCPVCAS